MAMNRIDIIDSQVVDEDHQDYVRLLQQANIVSPLEWDFEIVPGYFKQSNDATDDTRFNYIKEHFGIAKPWEEIINDLKKLNDNADSNTFYKVIYLARHGQGYHNLAHAQYGDKAWNEYWSKLNGDGKIVWGPDPLLTELGVSQAEENGEVISEDIGKGAKIIPSKWYVSPLSRSIDTLIHTWRLIVNIDTIKPLIMENLRETTGVHTCDKRLPKRVLVEKYPKFIIEPSFTEEDELFKVDYRETVGEIAVRMNKAFQFIFSDSKNESLICVTSHSGAIRAQLLALGHRLFAVGTGGVIPVFVKATRGEAKSAGKKFRL